MADQYIDEAYVDAALGINVRTALVAAFALSSGSPEPAPIYSLPALIERGTALVQSLMRNSGYPTPAEVTDETVKLAVMAVVRRLLSSMPANNLALPEAWESHPEQVAFLGILSGDVILTLPQSTSGAVGGWLFTSHSPGLDTAPRATRAQLRGY